MSDSLAPVPALFSVPTLVGGWSVFASTKPVDAVANDVVAADDTSLADTALADTVIDDRASLFAALRNTDVDVHVLDAGIEASLDVGLAPYSPSNLVTGFSGEVEGVFIATHASLSIGDRVEVLLHLPGEHGVLAAARVEWIRVEDTLDAPAGVGVSFERLEDYERELLATFASHREPLFYAA